MALVPEKDFICADSPSQDGIDVFEHMDPQPCHVLFPCGIRVGEGVEQTEVIAHHNKDTNGQYTPLWIRLTPEMASLLVLHPMAKEVTPSRKQ